LVEVAKSLSTLCDGTDVAASSGESMTQSLSAGKSLVEDEEAVTRVDSSRGPAGANSGLLSGNGICEMEPGVQGKVGGVLSGSGILLTLNGVAVRAGFVGV